VQSADVFLIMDLGEEKGEERRILPALGAIRVPEARKSDQKIGFAAGEGLSNDASPRPERCRR
jgi:hypothetical protein